MAFKRRSQFCPCYPLILTELFQKWPWPPIIFRNSPDESGVLLSRQGWKTLVYSVLFSPESHSESGAELGFESDVCILEPNTTLTS